MFFVVVVLKINDVVRVAVGTMMFGGRGMRGGRGGMLRSVGGAVTCKVYGTDTVTVSSPNFASASSRKLKSSNNIISAFPFWHSSPDTDDCDWVHVDDASRGFSVLGPVPSENEVEDALSALQQVFGSASHSQLFRDKYCYKLDNELDHVAISGLIDRASSDGSETDWEEPSLFPYNSKLLQLNGSDRVYYAFHLLQTEPYVQRMVKSLSSDKAVWDAVLSNEVVQELRESISADDENVFQSPDGTSSCDDSHTTTNVVMWIIDTIKTKFMEVIDKITKIVNELFQPADHMTDADADAECPDPFNYNLRISFILSIMVLLVVMVTRAQARV